MKANKTRISFITLILTVALMFSLFSIGVFAESTPVESVPESTPVESVPESTPAESTTATGTTAESTPAATNSAATTSASTTGGSDAKGKDKTATIVSLCILGVIVLAITLFCIIKREKVGKFFRSLKSETKKVVWLPWDQVRKNSIVVIIVVVIFAIVIGLLDFAFSQGIINLGTLFKK